MMAGESTICIFRLVILGTDVITSGKWTQILGLKFFGLPEDLSRKSCRKFVCAQKKKERRWNVQRDNRNPKLP